MTTRALSAGTSNLEVCFLSSTHTHIDVTLLFQDKMVFWGSLYATPLVWLLFCVMSAITFSIFKTATTFVCMLIGAVQYWGFKNCKAAHERKMKILARRKAKGFFRGGAKPSLNQNA